MKLLKLYVIIFFFIQLYFSEVRAHTFLIYLKRLVTLNKLITNGQMLCVTSCIFKKGYELEIAYKGFESMDI